MLGGLDLHTIAVAVRRALSTVGVVITNPANTTQALTDGATVNWDASLGAIATLTVGGNRTVAAPTNLKTGGTYVLHVTQDATGGRSLTWNTVFKGVAGDSMPQPNLGAGVVTVFTFQSPDGALLRLSSYSVRSPILAKSGTAVSCPADTTEDVLATITLPANALGANGAIKFTINFVCTNSANQKTFKLRHSGAAGNVIASYNVTTEPGAVLSGLGFNQNVTNAQSWNTIFNLASSSFNTINSTGAIDTTASTTIVITGQKASAGETLTLKNYLFEIVSDGT